MRVFVLAPVLAFGAIALAWAQPLGLYPPDVPPGNEITEARTKLGEALFFDRRLSRSGNLSCASCHQPQNAYSDPLPFRASDGAPVHRRNAPGLLNAGYRRLLGWQGNARSLEEQVELSFGPYGDMGVSMGDALERIADTQSYKEGCAAAYHSSVTSACVTQAIATFERSLVSANSRFDSFLYGGDKAALSDQEKRGWEIFSGRGACIDCHDVFHPEVNPLGGAYATFSDERFHNLGVGYHGGRMSDAGRYEVTRDPDDFGAFKTPMLRNVSRTAPYMHDGSLKSLEDVVEFYNKGGIANRNQTSGIKPLYLTAEEKKSLVAFLKALSSDYYAAARPAH